MPKLFSCEWSFAQFRIEKMSEFCSAVFSADNQIYVFCNDGRFFNIKFGGVVGGGGGGGLEKPLPP